MKLFTLIFSTYLLLLSCMPCADKDECISNLRNELSIASSHPHKDKSAENEACTPFCSCSHCTASALLQAVKKYSIVKIFVRSSQYPVYNISFSSEAMASIWQPPKLN